jgi:hypothetical protein
MKGFVMRKVLLLILAASVCTVSAVTVDIGAAADTDIRQIAPDYGLSNRSGMWTSSVTGNSIKGYMRFELPTDIDYIVSASLTLTRHAAGAWNFTYDIYGLDDDVAENDWQEINSARNPGDPYTLGLTWNNAPGNDTSSATSFDPAESSMLGSFMVLGSTYGGAAGETYSVSTVNVANFLETDSDGNVTFMIARNSGESTSLDVFGTRETSTPAVLSIEYVAVPEPLTIALLGVGGIFIRIRK